MSTRNESLSTPESQLECEKQKFIVTIETSRYRRVIVEALNWQHAQAIVNEELPKHCEIPIPMETGQLKVLADQLDFETIRDIVFIDSEDGEDTHYERP